MRRRIREYGRHVLSIAFLALLALVCGTYIMVNQRLQLPTQERYTIFADLPSSSGLSPGLGQAVNVAGVKVGQIADAEIVGGVARIELRIDPGKLPRVYENATAALIPNTPLKDMLLELVPGRPPADPLPEGGLIAVAHTEGPVDSDELTSALDADTRDFLDLLVGDGASGTRGRGDDLNRLLKSLRPTTVQLRRVSTALSARRRELRRLVSNLAILTRAAGTKDRELARVVEAANATLGAVASQEDAVRASLDRLPRTLRSVRGTLDNVAGLSTELAPTLDLLLPAVRKLPGALRAADPLLVEATPALREHIRPLVRDLAPVARDLEPATANLTAVTPDLTVSFQVLNYVVNEVLFNPPGDDEGFLFWTAWFAHNGASMLSVEDAHGSVWRGLALFHCSTFSGQPQLAAVMDTIFGAVPACDSR